jgi:hypothetical protein
MRLAEAVPTMSVMRSAAARPMIASLVLCLIVAPVFLWLVIV